MLLLPLLNMLIDESSETQTILIRHLLLLRKRHRVACQIVNRLKKWVHLLLRKSQESLQVHLLNALPESHFLLHIRPLFTTLHQDSDLIVRNVLPKAHLDHHLRIQLLDLCRDINHDTLIT